MQILDTKQKVDCQTWSKVDQTADIWQVKSKN